MLRLKEWKTATNEDKMGVLPPLRFSFWRNGAHFGATIIASVVLFACWGSRTTRHLKSRIGTFRNSTTKQCDKEVRWAKIPKARLMCFSFFMFSLSFVDSLFALFFCRLRYCCCCHPMDTKWKKNLMGVKAVLVRLISLRVVCVCVWRPKIFDKLSKCSDTYFS